MDIDTYNYIFYKIECLDSNVDFRYVGSTKNLKHRLRLHKSECHNENSKKYNTKKYKFIRANGGWSNFKVVELGRREQISKRQAEQIEEEYRQELDANMNSKRCHITEEQRKEYCNEWREDNKDEIKKYREDNKEKAKKYREDNKEKAKNYYENNKEKLKEYGKKWREDNRNTINEKAKKYRENNKEKIIEKKEERLPCECGCKVSYVNFAQHKKSQKHIDLINNINK